MIKLGGLVELKPINEEEVFTATNKETGNVSVFKSKSSRDAAVKSGSHEMRKDDKEGAVEKPTSKVNIFDKPSQDKQEPKSNSYSGNSEDMKMDMQNAFEDGYTGKGLKGVKKTKDGFQVNMASYMNDNSFKDVLDSFNKTNGTNFVAGKIEKTAGGTRVTISEPSKEEPKSEPSQPKRQGNPEVNKATQKLAKQSGMTPDKFQSKKEYQDAMIGAAVSALTDANFHSEARELVAKVLGRPELAKKPEYPSLKDPDFDQKMAKIKDFYSAGDKYTKPSDEAQEFGEKVAQEAGWSGDDALDGIANELRAQGFAKLADTIQSVIKENKSTRLKDIV